MMSTTKKPEGLLEWFGRMTDRTDRVAEKVQGIRKANDRLQDGAYLVKLHGDVLRVMRDLGLKKGGGK